MFEVLTRIYATADVSPDLAITPAEPVTRHIVHFAPFVAILVFAIALPVLIARLLGQRHPGKGASSSATAARGDLHEDDNDQRSQPPSR